MDKDLIPLLDLRLGVDYSPKGSRQENGNDFDQLQLNYLEIPIQAKIKLGPVYALGRITSYNVCYTKLLRIDSQLNSGLPNMKILRRLWW